MKFVVAFVALFSVALALPAQNPADAQAEVRVLKFDIQPSGDYNHELETSNGIKAAASGQVKPNQARSSPEDPEKVVAVRGSFSFLADDGQTYTVNYVADENGFQPQGAHLPVAPVAPVA